MAKCTHCGKEVLVGTGFTVFKRDGTALHFCSKKCSRNAEMGRSPRRQKWTAKFVKGQ